MFCCCRWISKALQQYRKILKLTLTMGKRKFPVRIPRMHLGRVWNRPHYEAPDEFWFNQDKTKWLTLSYRGCHFFCGENVALGQPNGWLKTFYKRYFSLKGSYMFTVTGKKTRVLCCIYSKSIVKTPERVNGQRSI